MNAASDPYDIQKRVYFVMFDTPPGGFDSTVLLDARNSTTGRGIPIKVQRGSPIHLTLTVNVDNEFTAGQALSVCFSLFR
ncbi:MULTISPECIES: hypothetical protein [Delftia]|uniref:Uncharacterized protein n=2 Tax=Delftia TaxID=80865 RepID=A0A7T2W0Z6_DELAC|nr:hypothetical protein [Delftia acidovorans]MBB1650226.1 hypothetical protein [Delftia sp. UME58]QPS09897.1 hypothetical protein I6G66_07790 [Delftia acidovorans]